MLSATYTYLEILPGVLVLVEFARHCVHYVLLPLDLGFALFNALNQPLPVGQLLVPARYQPTTMITMWLKIVGPTAFRL